MRCRACDAPLAPNAVFPGGKVRCACGVDNEVEGLSPPAEHGPYRQPSPRAGDEALPLAGKADLGPLCPRCTRRLRADEGGYDALGCDHCGGRFVAHAALTALLDRERSAGDGGAAQPPKGAAPPERDVRYARCPSCGEPMARMNFGQRSGVVVDVCRTHGTWFDGRELDAVLQFARDGGLEAEVHPPTSPAVTAASEASMRALTAELVLDGLHQQQSIEHVAEAVDDVFFLLFGPRRHMRRW